jgi:glycosyltransferase involved in cell wall biosynthesis
MGYPVDDARRRAGELGIDRSVTFTGRVDYARLPGYLSLVDLAVAPKVSRTEGNGKLYNYASMALPIVAIDNAVNREVLADDAYYARSQTPEAFAEAIEAALRDRWSWPARGRRLRARIVSEFTWDAVALRLLAAYRTVTVPTGDG